MCLQQLIKDTLYHDLQLLVYILMGFNNYFSHPPILASNLIGVLDFLLISIVLSPPIHVKFGLSYYKITIEKAVASRILQLTY